MTESWLKISVVLTQKLVILLRKRSNFLRNFPVSRENDTAKSWKAWQRLRGPSNLGCLSVRQLDSWQKYNHESLLRNLKSPKAWLRLSTPIEHKCSPYFVAAKQTILIASKNNQLLFQHAKATVIVMLQVQKRWKVKLHGSECDVDEQKEIKPVLLNELFLFSCLHYLKVTWLHKAVTKTLLSAILFNHHIFYLFLSLRFQL